MLLLRSREGAVARAGTFCSIFLLCSATLIAQYSSTVFAEECFTNLDTSRQALEKALAECQAQIEKK